MKLQQARHYADKIVGWLRPFCERIEVVGSVRRQRPECNDIDLVVIARVIEQKDLLGNVVETRNRVFEELDRYVKENAEVRSPKSEVPIDNEIGWLSGQLRGDKNFLLRLRQCELNAFGSTAETLGATYLTYTGSKEHNIWLSKRARRMGCEWKATRGLFLKSGEVVPGPVVNGTDGADGTDRANDLVAAETAIYAQLQLPWIQPQLREIGYLEKVFGEEPG